MRITPIQNHSYSNINFKGTIPVNTNRSENYKAPKRNNDEHTHHKTPEWFRKGVLFGLITLAVANDPATQEFLKPEEVKQQEKTLNEYYNDVADLYSTPAHHLNMLADVDKPEIKSKGRGNYNIKLNLDNGKKFDFDVSTSEKNGNILYGYFKSEDNKSLKYKAVFNPQNPEEFEIFVRSKDNQKYIFGRKANGEFYKLEKGKQIILNKQNAKRYQNELKAQEKLDETEFFSNKNDFWRKLNLVLLILLVLNEWGHDLQRRDEAKESEKQNKK